MRAVCAITGKDIHPTRARSGQIRGSHSKKKGKGIDQYRCKFCGGWHLGHRSRAKRAKSLRQKEDENNE